MREKDLYLSNSYLNIPEILNLPVAFIYIIGARGIGKTYGILEYLILNKIKFLYLRRLQTQIDLITKPAFNPFKKLNSDKNWDIYPYSVSKNNYGFYNTVYDSLKNKRVPVEGEDMLGISGALSTFSNARGFDASDVDFIFYDEFVPEEVESKLRGEADAFFNLIETVNRNRELEGKPPCRVVCASNSTDAANSIFMALNLVTTVMKMQYHGEQIRIIKEREIGLIVPSHSPISEAKKETALYKMTTGTAFADSALENKFINNTPTSIRQRPLQEYKPIVIAGELCIYKHKSNKRYYVSNHMSGNPDRYNASEKELAIFRKRYSNLQTAVYRENIDYENYACELLFDKYINSCYY